jgi:hypothetical protein
MKLKSISCIALTAGALAAANAAHAVQIDPDGAAALNGAVNAASLDFPAGNIIATCMPGVAGNCQSATDVAQGNILQVFGHNQVSGILNENGQNIAFGLNNPLGFEWTLSFGFAELVTNVTATDLDGVVLGPGTGVNFFELYYDPTPDASNLQGTGFQNGTLILAGTIRGFEGIAPFGLTDFSVNGDTVSNDPGGNTQLDDFGVDNYANVFGAGTTIESITGSGGASVIADISFQDSAFFLNDLTSLALELRTDQFLPYNFVNPSSCFYNAAGQVTPGLTGAGLNGAGGGGCGDGMGATPGGTIGPVNGVTGPNIVFETDGRATFPVAEPTTLALLGLSFITLGAAKRRRKA